MAQVGVCNMRIVLSSIEGHQCKGMVLDQVRRVERVSDLTIGDKVSYPDGYGVITKIITITDVEHVYRIEGILKVTKYLYDDEFVLINDQPQLNENQQIAINNSKKSFEKGADLYDCAIDMVLYDGLTDKEWAKATLAFLLWAQQQEE